MSDMNWIERTAHDSYFHIIHPVYLPGEDDLLLIVFSLAVKHDFLANDLNNLRTGALCDYFSQFAGIVGTVLKDTDLDQFPGCKRL